MDSGGETWSQKAQLKNFCNSPFDRQGAHKCASLCPLST